MHQKCNLDIFWRFKIPVLKLFGAITYLPWWIAKSNLSFSCLLFAKLIKNKVVCWRSCIYSGVWRYLVWHCSNVAKSKKRSFEWDLTKTFCKKISYISAQMSEFLLIFSFFLSKPANLQAKRWAGRFATLRRRFDYSAMFASTILLPKLLFGTSARPVFLDRSCQKEITFK